MIYNKNNAMVVGKVLQAGHRFGEYSLTFLEINIDGKSRLIPISTNNLKKHPKINATVSVEGVVKVVNDVPFIEATNMTVCKAGKHSQHIDITGYIEKSIGRGRYMINNGEDSFIVRIPIKDESIIKVNGIAHLSCVISSPILLNKANIDLRSYKLLGIRMTNL